MNIQIDEKLKERNDYQVSIYDMQNYSEPVSNHTSIRNILPKEKATFVNEWQLEENLSTEARIMKYLIKKKAKDI